MSHGERLKETISGVKDKTFSSKIVEARSNAKGYDQEELVQQVEREETFIRGMYNVTIIVWTL